MLVKVEENLCCIEVKPNQTKMVIINLSSSTTGYIPEIYNSQCDVIIKKMSEFQKSENRWTLTQILRVVYSSTNTNTKETCTHQF